MATNITAIGYIGKDLSNRNRVFINGLIYTAGRAFSYTVLAIVLFIGADKMELSLFFQRHGAKILGPFLVVAGLLLLGILKINFPFFKSLSGKMEGRTKWSFLHVFLLGIIFALAFCPYSGVLYFGMLIPLTISSTSGLHLPIVFAIATGIPVILISWIIAFAIANIGRFYNALKTFEFWMRRVIAVLFIGVGIYYIYIIYLSDLFINNN